jgi:pyruvate dehydrogenase E1 component
MNRSEAEAGMPTTQRLEAMKVARDYVAKGALSMIDWANNKPANRGMKPKVGGHQASSMSSLDILCALYLHARAPQDRMAVKPHAAPVLYSLMHLMGHLSTDQMGELREMGGPQPYPTKLKDPLFVDYTTSSEALGVCAAIYDAYGAKLQNRSLVPSLGVAHVDATYWALVGDGELTEGQIDESLYDAGRWGLNNLVWIVDLNRQSLDRVMDDSAHGLHQWVDAKFRGQGWSVISLRWGAQALALFGREGGEVLRQVLEGLPDDLFHSLMMVPGEHVRSLLLGRSGDDVAAGSLADHFTRRCPLSPPQSSAVQRALDGVTDDELERSVRHLGGHDLEALAGAMAQAKAYQGGPVVILAHTVKGYETSAAAHPENHGMLLPSEEVVAWGIERGLPEREPYPLPELGSAAARLIRQRSVELWEEPDHSYTAPDQALLEGALEDLSLGARKKASTGEAFQSLNLAMLRGRAGHYLQFGAPDVGQTTHLGPIIKATGVFAPRDLPDTYAWLRQERRLAFDWRPEATGQFHALGIAEGNALLWAYAFGRRKKVVEGKINLLPVVTVYDKFFERGFNQLDYATYSDARFLAVGTPSGTGLSRETATHQSLQTLRMLMDLPGILAYEPAFGQDVRAIYAHALRQMWSEEGEATYMRLTTQPLEQPTELPADHERAAIGGGYWLVGDDDRRASGGLNVIFVASGRKLREVRMAAALLSQDHGIGSRILNVTSYEALWRDWDAYASNPDSWSDPSRSYRLHDLFSDADVNAPLILTGDHLPSACEWLPAALQRTRGYRFLGPRRNGETGSLEQVDALHGMGVDDLVAAALAEIAWRAEDGLL